MKGKGVLSFIKLIKQLQGSIYRLWFRYTYRFKLKKYRVRLFKKVIIALAVAGVLYGAQFFKGYMPNSINADEVRIFNGGNAETVIYCSRPYIIDGDTFSCGERRIRLASIDAPEMPGHCAAGRHCTPGDPYASKQYLISISRGTVTCHEVDTDHYGRTVARCDSGGKDLSCEMVASGHAVEMYGVLECP